jgi:hypothetical protein
MQPHVHGVTVGWRFRCGVSADHAAASGTIFSEGRFPTFTQPLSKRSREQIGYAACRRRHDNFNRPGGMV